MAMRASRWEVVNRSFESIAMPYAPAVYIAMEGKRVIYVGQTGNFRKRIPAHNIVFNPAEMTWFTPWGEFKDFRIKVSTGGLYGSWAMRELRLIKKLKPEFNCLHGTRAKKANG